MRVRNRWVPDYLGAQTPVRAPEGEGKLYLSHSAGLWDNKYLGGHVLDLLDCHGLIVVKSPGRHGA